MKGKQIAVAIARAAEPASPLLYHLRLVLTNGASITLPTVSRREKPLFATFDPFNHNLWQHAIKTEAALDAEQRYSPDYSSFYKKSKVRGSAKKGSANAAGSSGKEK